MMRQQKNKSKAKVLHLGFKYAVKLGKEKTHNIQAPVDWLIGKLGNPFRSTTSVDGKDQSFQPNYEGIWMCRTYKDGSGVWDKAISVEFSFQNSADALMFKLKWS